MKFTFNINVGAAICFAGAVYLIATGNESGWGWLLFIGLLIA